jgi:predicted DNA-binding transcriptional regulator AlpA
MSMGVVSMELIRQTKDPKDQLINDLGSVRDLKLLTYAELEKLTGLSRKTIDDWKDNWGLPYIQKDKHCQIYFPVGPIKSWIREKIDNQSVGKESEVTNEIWDEEILR